MTTGIPPKCRALFLSDLHLGSPHSQASKLLAFIQKLDFEILYLVGDVFDSPGIALPGDHLAVLLLVLARLRTGVKTVYIPGNHDAVFRDLCGDYGNLTIVRGFVHVTAAGKTIAITHGDEFDWWATTGSFTHLVDRWLPIPFWEILRRVLTRLISSHVDAFQRRAVTAFPDYDSVLVGHVHTPAMDGAYLNTGDWIKHCSAVLEHLDGRLELIDAS